MKWHGVMPAMTTCFDERLQVDAAFMTAHARWLLDNGCTGIVSLGSLGQAATLTFAEKEAILRNMTAACRGSRAGGRRHLRAFDGRGGRAGEGGRAGRLLRPDGAAAVCVLRRLARDEGARDGGVSRHAALVHALQQSCCVRHGFSS